MNSKASKSAARSADPAPIKVLVGPSTTQTPYIVATDSGVWFTSILSVGDQVGTKPDGTPWSMVGIPDGLGAMDNGDGTMTVLMNHEIRPDAGVIREHGSVGAFVSKLTIDKSTLEVKAAEDLTKTVYLYNTATGLYEEKTTAFARFCSADLPDVGAFYDAETGLGTKDRIFMNGEETGAEGRSFAHVVTGSEAGDTYELPRLGKYSSENSLANAYSGAKTVVIGLDDTTPGELYIYAGDKTATGTAVEKAGLTNGKLYGLAASFGDDPAATPTEGTFTLVSQGTDGDVSKVTGTALNAAAGPLTQFGRPEDGHWDPTNPDVFYFLTTGTSTVPSRLWKLEFTDVRKPELGGKISVVIEGDLSGANNNGVPVSLDNMTITDNGLVVMQEDTGGSARLAKIWAYDPAKDNSIDKFSSLTELAAHDPARFTNPAGPTATPAPFSTTGFGTDEESSGIIDLTDMLGKDQKMAFLLDTQAHYRIGGELVEGGQLMAMMVELPNPGDTEFEGTAAADMFDGGFGDDELEGAGGNDTLIGSYGNDKLEGEDGADTLHGGAGNDKLDGDEGADTLKGGLGKDELKGDKGDDKLYGDLGNDKLDGGQGKDMLWGGYGNDKVKGGSGDDMLWLGYGNDTLVFGRGSGHDTVMDFDANPALGQDKIDVSGRGITGVNFASLVTITDTAEGALVRIGSDTLLLTDVAKSDVTFADFIV